MADFLVMVNGKYLYNGITRYFEAPELFQGAIDYFKEYLGLPPDFDESHYDIIFNDKTGRVQIFGKYMALFSTKTSEYTGYIEIEKFWNNAKPSLARRNYVVQATGIDLRYYRKFDNFIISTIPLVDKVVPKEGDRIILSKREIDQNTYKIKTTIKSFDYPSSSHPLYQSIKDGLDYSVDSNGNDTSVQIISNDSFLSQLPNFNPQVIDEDLIIVANHHLGVFYSVILENGYLRPGDSNPSSLTSYEIDMIESITLIFQHLFKINAFTQKLTNYNFYYLFEKFFEIFKQPIDDNTDVISREDYYQSFNERYFDLLYLRLHEFYVWAKGGLFITEYGLLARIFGLFDFHVLKHLSYDKKLELLTLMLFNNSFVSGKWNWFESDNKLSEEEVIVKIIQSIKRTDNNGSLNYSEINDFMDKLNASPFYEPTTSPRTLFEVLYTKIDDDVFFGDDGTGNKGQLVKAIYSLWADSKYNPSNELIPENQRIMPDYTTYHALWQYDDPNITNKNIDYNAKPLLIDYESEKILLWYNDNFEFPFYKNQILATREVWKSGTEMILQSLANLVFPYKDFDYTKYVPFGFYGIFDPISIRQTNSDDTIIKIPLSVESLQNPCDVNEGNNRNEIPIFYLKYVNDLANYSNFKETIGTTVDVILTFTGVGNITKVRYLTKASTVRRYITGSAQVRAAMVASGETALILRTTRQVLLASWEIFLGTAGILHSITTNSCGNYLDPCNPLQPGDPNYEKYEDCQTIQGWLLAFEIFTLSGDLLAKRYFRKKSYELRQRITHQKINDEPNSYFTDEGVTKTQVNDFLDELADIASEYNTFYNSLPSSVRSKLDDLGLSNDKKYAFMFDFENRTDEIAQLAARPNLIDDWAEVVDELAHFRKDLKYLDSYHRFTQNPHEVLHITNLKNKAAGTGFDPIGAHAGKNLTNGVYRDPNLPSPIPNKPATSIKAERNGHILYLNMWYNRPGGGNPKRVAKKTIWNPEWDDLRIKGEMALAFKNKKLKMPTINTGINLSGYSPPPIYQNVYRSYLSDGTEVEMQIYNFRYDPITNLPQQDYLGYFELIIE